MSTEQERQAIRAAMAALPSEKLRAQRQVLHQRKLTDGLIVPGRRAQLDTLVSMITDELASREPR